MSSPEITYVWFVGCFIFSNLKGVVYMAFLSLFWERVCFWTEYASFFWSMNIQPISEKRTIPNLTTIAHSFSPISFYPTTNMNLGTMCIGAWHIKGSLTGYGICGCPISLLPLFPSPLCLWMYGFLSNRSTSVVVNVANFPFFTIVLFLRILFNLFQLFINNFLSCYSRFNLYYADNATQLLY